MKLRCMKLLWMKVEKAAGCGKVSSDILKGGGGIVANLLYQLFINAGKPGGYLMAGVKPLLYFSIKEKPTARLHKLPPYKPSQYSLANYKRKPLLRES
ncbi:hypothetical protein EVAR_35956_1 [Eumeta japonica]|uniref:Uncharacterized protein n=1 Tax=Eumeta variegata TaxID=151549 RepID=A0A4C1W6H4_EUMVA|nr:hypothetical protein EVAR_35956_1 [Eumeta japonica]